REGHAPTQTAHSHPTTGKPRALPLLVVADSLVNFLAMVGVVVPGGGELGLRERLLVTIANLVVGQTESFCLNQHPYRDAAIADAGIAADDARRLANHRGEGGLALVRHGNTPRAISARRRNSIIFIGAEWNRTSQIPCTCPVA